MQDNITTAEYLRAARIDKGLTISDAARLAGLSESTVRRYETEGISGRCLLMNVLSVLEAYGINCHIQDLLDCRDMAGAGTRV